MDGLCAEEGSDEAVVTSLLQQQVDFQQGDGASGVPGSLAQREMFMAQSRAEGDSDFVSGIDIEGYDAIRASSPLAKATQVATLLSRDAAILNRELQDLRESFAMPGARGRAPLELEVASPRLSFADTQEYQSAAFGAEEQQSMNAGASVVDSNGAMAMVESGESAESAIAEAVAAANAAATRAEAAAGDARARTEATKLVNTTEVKDKTQQTSGNVCDNVSVPGCSSFMKLFTLNYAVSVSWACVHWAVVLVFGCTICWCCCCRPRRTA